MDPLGPGNPTREEPSRSRGRSNACARTWAAVEPPWDVEPGQRARESIRDPRVDQGLVGASSAGTGFAPCGRVWHHARPMEALRVLEFIRHADPVWNLPRPLVDDLR